MGMAARNSASTEVQGMGGGKEAAQPGSKLSLELSATNHVFGS